MSGLSVAPGGPLKGRLRVPGDKSISHRALMLGAMATGQSSVRGLLRGADVHNTLACVRALGVEVHPKSDGTVRVEGCAGRLAEPLDVLDCGNSGTTMRLLAGVLAGQPILSLLTGDASLRRRPMGRIVQPLRALGAQIDGRHRASRAPLAIRGGSLRDASLTLELASAQVKSALLFAALSAGSALELHVRPSRDHSECMLEAMGARLTRTPTGEGGERLDLEAGSALQAAEIHVPGDISSAAFLLVAAALVPGSDLVIEEVGLNPSRTGVLDVLQRMGARLEYGDRVRVAGEEVGTVRVVSSVLEGTEIGGGEIPRLIDELPVLALAAALAQGETVVRDAAELRHKESDRIASTVDLLRSLGVEAEARPDGFVVQGSAGAPLQGASLAPTDDHRLAMTGAVAGLLSTGGVYVPEPGCIDVSFPGFADTLGRLRGSA